MTAAEHSDPPNILFSFLLFFFSSIILYRWFLGVSSDDDTSLLKKRLVIFCESKSIATNGVLAITIQRSRTGEFCSVIIDMDTGIVADMYPADDLSDYKEGRVGAGAELFLYCYHANLDPSKVLHKVPTQTRTSASQFQTTGSPFCCSSLELYKPGHTSHDDKFSAFVHQRGSVRGMVFEVKAQVNNGPLVSTKYYSLDNGVVSEHEGKFNQKVHAFKNYKCQAHDLFFAVDLYKADNSKTSNYHHMRLNPFTKVNPGVLSAFFKAAGV